jgi:hypothetical protein
LLRRELADAAGRLSPQIPPRDKVDLDMISHCADRYRVSLIAAILRWLAYTDRRAVLVVSREGFILWSRASETALRTGAFFRTSGGPIEIPSTSLAATQDQLVDARAGLQHGPGVWFPEPSHEMTIFSELYAFTITFCSSRTRVVMCRSSDPRKTPLIASLATDKPWPHARYE